MYTQTSPPRDAPASTESPSTETFERSERLLLLRFSQETRDALDQWEREDSTVSASSAVSTTTRRRPKRRILRAFVGLLLFVIGLSSAVFFGLLEMRYRQVAQKGVLFKQIEVALEKGKRGLSKEESKEVFHALPPYLTQLDTALTQLQRVHTRLCTGLMQARSRWHSSSSIAHVLQTWMSQGQHLLWERYHRPYLQARKLLWRQTLLHPPLLAKLCKQEPKALLAVLKRQLHQSSQRLLRQAKLHLRNDGWCRMHWGRYQHHPIHRRFLNKLRKRRCERACRQRGEGCRLCLQTWRKMLGLSLSRFHKYRMLVHRERRRRCLQWDKSHAAFDGVFHLGEYFWRVRRILAYMALLQRHHACGEACQALQKRWGFRLQLQSEPIGGLLYIQLWSARAKAPTKQLQALSQYPLGRADGHTIWLPALRDKLPPAQTPRDHWYLLHIYHRQTQWRALLPLAPHAGGILKRHITLHDLRLHNDGRQPVRFATISRRANGGAWFSFVTFRLLPWEKSLRFALPYCWSPPAHAYPLTWRAAISTYPLDAQARPLDHGRHLYTGQWLRSLQLQDHPQKPLLLTSAAGSPLSLGPAPHTRRASLWRIVLPSSSSQRPQVTQISHAARPDFVELPMGQHPQNGLILCLSCNMPTHLALLRIPAAPPPKISLPRGYHLLHAAQNQTTLALLLRSIDSKRHTALALYAHRQVDPSRPIQLLKLPYHHRQLVPTQRGYLLAGGPWGSPLQRWERSGLKTLAAATPTQRYLDPALTPSQTRLFVIRQERVVGSPKQLASFLLSLPVKHHTDRRRTP